MLEEHYELRDGIVMDEWYFLAMGDREPLYTKNVCDRYRHYIANDGDPNWVRYGFDQYHL
jgi:hypothetical protein